MYKLVRSLRTHLYTTKIYKKNTPLNENATSGFREYTFANFGSR